MLKLIGKTSLYLLGFLLSLIDDWIPGLVALLGIAVLGYGYMQFNIIGLIVTVPIALLLWIFGFLFHTKIKTRLRDQYQAWMKA